MVLSQLFSITASLDYKNSTISYIDNEESHHFFYPILYEITLTLFWHILKSPSLLLYSLYKIFKAF